MLNQTEANQVAVDFLMTEWELSDDDREWFAVLNSRAVQQSWYVVEVGVEGLPDRWVFQVYDTGECDPNYTFVSPVAGATSDTSDLEELPEKIADAIASERHK